MDNTEDLPLPNALAFAGRGHGIVPLYGIVGGICGCGNPKCSSAGKHPHAKLAPNGLKNATTDRATIRTWFAEFPTINYGVCTDNLPTVDIDPRNGGDKAWLELIKKNCDVHSWRAQTGGGGQHIMFGTVLKPVPSGKLARGVDVKGVGGYIVGVGSMHLSGKRYKWFPQCHPREVELMGPPLWITNKLSETNPTHYKSARTPDYYNELLAPALPGERHHRVASFLGHLFSRKPERAVQLALVISHVKLTYPDQADFGDDEITKIALGIANKEDKKAEAA